MLCKFLTNERSILFETPVYKYLKNSKCKDEIKSNFYKTKVTIILCE